VLIVLSFVKFGMVGLYFMHLKFDTHLFRRLFVLGIILALTVYAVALVTLLNYH
jgi:cytochrome c oxidase subunit 4